MKGATRLFLVFLGIFVGVAAAYAQYGYIAQLNVAYGVDENEHPLYMDVYYPTGDGIEEQTDRIALMPFNNTGDKDFFSNLGKDYARDGFVTFVPAFDGANIMRDTETCIRHIRANHAVYGVSPDRIATWGGSLSGSVSLYLATHDTPHATPFVHPDNNNGASGKANAAVEIAGGAWFPSDWDSSDGYILIIHAKDDPIVPYTYGLAARELCIENNLLHAFYLSETGGHVIGTALNVDGYGMDVVIPNFLKNAFLKSSTTETALLHAKSTGPGRAVPTPEQCQYKRGKVVTVEAVPDTGQQLLYWTGDVASTDPVITLTMDTHHNVEAVFGDPATAKHLTVNISGLGTVQLDPVGGYYPNGTVVTLTAAPHDNSLPALFEYGLFRWTGDASGTAASIKIVMDADKTVEAVFSNANAVPVVSFWALVLLCCGLAGIIMWKAGRYRMTR